MFIHRGNTSGFCILNPPNSYFNLDGWHYYSPYTLNRTATSVDDRGIGDKSSHPIKSTARRMDSLYESVKKKKTKMFNLLWEFEFLQTHRPACVSYTKKITRTNNVNVIWIEIISGGRTRVFFRRLQRPNFKA